MVSILKRNDLLANLAPRQLKTFFHRSPAQKQTIRSFRFPTYEITLMAHGECEEDITKQFGGWIDSKLSPFGVEQAKRAGKIMAYDETNFHVAYTSELDRAQDTVKHVLDPLLVKPKVFATWRLNDRHYGDLSGYNRNQMALVHGERKVKEWTDEYAAMPPIIKVENPHYRQIMESMNRKHLTPDQIPRAESLQMVYNRVIPYWDNIIIPSLKMRNKVIVIAHNAPLCALVRKFSELTESEALHIHLPPGIPFTFTLDNHMKIIKGKSAKKSSKAKQQFIQGANSSTSTSSANVGASTGTSSGQVVAQQVLKGGVKGDIKTS